jgi:hypothetical protein
MKNKFSINDRLVFLGLNQIYFTYSTKSVVKLNVKLIETGRFLGNFVPQLFGYEFK